MITDGTSNTAAFSERVKAIGSTSRRRRPPSTDRKPTASLATPPAGRQQPRGDAAGLLPGLHRRRRPCPVNGNQDAANFIDDNISGAMWVSGQPA